MTIYRFEHCHFDSQDGHLTHADSGKAQVLRPQVARLLTHFLDHPGQLQDREMLYRAVWDAETIIDFEAGLAAVLRELRRNFDAVGLDGSLIETVPRRGYRLRAKVQMLDSGQVATVPDRSGMNSSIRIGVVSLLLVLALLLAWWLVQSPERTGPMPPRTMAILPFDFYGERADDAPRTELLLADTLLGALWKAELDGLVLIGRATILPYQSREDIAGAVARDLGVDLIIEGRIVAGDDGWQVSVRLLEMPGGPVAWSQTFERGPSAELPVQDVVDEVIREFRFAWELSTQATER